MATELYGVNAHVSETLVQTPVTVETNIVFYGTSPSGTVGAPILITSWADAVDKLGVSVDDGYTLTDACLAAFQACNISHIYCIPVANTAEAQASDYTAALLNISDLWMQYGVIANILVAPRCQDSDVIAALVTAAKKQNGQWDGIVIYDAIQDADQLDANGRPVLTELTSAKVKTSTDDITVCHWGYAKLLSGAVISGAAFRACRWAVQDMQNNGREPSRCSGNLSADIQSGCILYKSPTKAHGQYPATGNAKLIVNATFDGECRQYVDGNVLELLIGKSTSDGNKVAVAIIDKRFGIVNGMIAQGMKDFGDVTPTTVTAEDFNSMGLGDYISFSGEILWSEINEIEELTDYLTIDMSGATPSRAWDKHSSQSFDLYLFAAEIGSSGNIKVILKRGEGTTVNVSVGEIGSAAVDYGSDTSISASEFNELTINNKSMEDFVVFSGIISVSDIPESSSTDSLELQLSGGSNPALDSIVNINAKKSDLDQLSADGIDSFLNIGGGKYVTWGDHTAAFNNAEIQDERGRFDNYPRMRMRITNRFEQKWRPSIDAGMDAELRRYILSEEQDFLYYLVSVQALVGSPRCEFRPQDNTKDSIAKGHFYFKDFVTYTPPAKYIDLGVSFTDEGYTVYLED